MKTRKHVASVIAGAVAAIGFVSYAARAADLYWNGGSGADYWTNSGNNWLSAANAPTNWSSGSIAHFGDASNAGTSALAYDVDIAEAIVAQDMIIGNTPAGQGFQFTDFGGGTFTLNGNITKTATSSSVIFQLGQNDPNQGINLSAGNHVISLHDSPGDSFPEMQIDNAITGSGGLQLDNTQYESWGSLWLNNANNTYTGPTTISRGRVIITGNNALGATSSGTTISNTGTLSLGGGGIPVNTLGQLTINEPIRIERGVYTGGDAIDGASFAHYPYAVIAQNSGIGAFTHTFNGSLTIASADARFSVNTCKVIYNGQLIADTTATAHPTFTLVGDTVGVMQLTADNTAFGNAGGVINIGTGSVTLAADRQVNLGGASGSLAFTGGSYLQVNGTNGSNAGFMQDFGTHPVNYTTFNGGIDTPVASQVFNIPQNMAGTGFNKRGVGTVNLTGTNTFSAACFTDLGNLNIGTGSLTGTTQMGGIRVRSGTVTVYSGSTLKTLGTYTSIGVDSTGTNGGPDKGALNILAGANLDAADQDFNVSDNSNTVGVMNLAGTAIVRGTMYVSKNSGSVGTLNLLSGSSLMVGSVSSTGTVVVGRNLVVGQNGQSDQVNVVSGTLNISAGSTLNVGGEFQMGNNPGGRATVTMTGGTVNAYSWTQVGRVGSQTTFVLSGGTFNKLGANNFYIGENATGDSRMTMSGASTVFNETVGEFWIANQAGSKGTFTMTGGTVTTPNWTVVGRQGGSGVMDISGGTFTKGGVNNFYIGENATSTSLVNVHGTGQLIATAGNFQVANGGGSTGTLNIYETGTVSFSGTGNFAMISGSAANANLNISNNGRLNITNSGIFYVNNAGGTAILNMTDNAVLNYAATGGQFQIVNGSGTGTVNMTGSAQLLDVSRDLWVGQGGGTGVLNIGGNATVSSTGTWLVVGRSNATGIVNLTGGLLSKTGTQPFDMGALGGTGSLTQTGGTLLVSGTSTWVGENNVGIMDLRAGTATLAGVDVGRAAGGKGQLLVSGTAAVTTGNMNVGFSGTGTGTVVVTGTVPMTTSSLTVGNTDTASGLVNIGIAGTTLAAAGSVSTGAVTVGNLGAATGTLNVLTAGKISGTSLTVGGNNTAVGTVNISGGNATFTGPVNIGVAGAASGTVNLTAGSLTTTGIVGGASTGAKAFNFAGGTLATGNYSLPTGLSNAGTGILAPGGIGTVGAAGTITSGYVQGANATLAIDIAGDSSYDRLSAGASSVINGSLSVDSLGAYVPTVGVYFNVFTVTSGTLTGTPTLTGPDASQYKMRINGNVLQLTSINTSDYLRGDLNFDGNLDDSDTAAFILATVDESSYISTYVPAQYQATFSNADFLYIADFNYDGNVDDSDTAAFIQATVDGSFPPPPAGPSFTVSVPEPTSALGAATFGAAGLLARRRRR